MTPARGGRPAAAAWIAVAILLAAIQFAAGSRHAFGFDALPGGAVLALAMALAIGAAAALAVRDPPWVAERRTTAAVVALAALPVFYLLRTHLLNQDGNMLTPKFQAAVPATGAFMTHDELLEFYLHSRVWFYTHRWWGWTVVHSYQVVSCVAGSAFVYGLWRLAGRVARDRAWLFLLGALSGGYMQLFFGDAENYTVTAAIVVFYLIASCRFLAGEVPLVLPTVVLAVAMCFHLETGWMLPSLLYLFVVSNRDGRTVRSLVGPAAAGAAIVLGTFVYFNFNGLPLMRFFSSNAGHAIRSTRVFSFGMPARYWIEQANLLIVLCPAVAMLAPIAVWHPADRVTAFLAVTAGTMLFLQAVWKSQIGVFDDWNLYAIGGMITSILIWRVVAMTASTRLLRVAAAAVVALGWLQTYAWIIANHRAA